MSQLLSRLRRNPKPKPLIRQSLAAARCTDSCCYENSAYSAVEPPSSGGKLSKLGKAVGSVKLGKDGRPILRRSDTFTLKEGPPDELPDHIKYATYRKKKARNRDSIIEQDVFESLYTKPRPIATSKPAPAKPQRSFPSGLRSYPPPTTQVPPSKSPFHFTPTPAVRTKNKSPTVSRMSNTSSVSVTSSSKSQSPAVKPTEYLFGSFEHLSKTPKTPRTPKTPSSPRTPSSVNDPDDFDRYRTITLKDVRRSFRDKYLPNENANPDAGGNRHLPIWFVNVNESDAKPSSPVESPRTSTDRETYRSLTYLEFNDPEPAPRSRPTVSRNDTFKVSERPAVRLQRRETFKVHEPMAKPAPEAHSSPPSTPKGYYLNRYRQHIEPTSVSPSADRPVKIIPVGIATPYNSLNDRDMSSYRRTPSPPVRLRRQKSPSPPKMRPQSFSTATYTRKPQRPSQLPVSTPERPQSMSTGSAYTQRPSGKISFDALRKPSEPAKDPTKTNLGFDRFYDPNYFVPKNQNLFGPLATAHLRSVNVEVQPKRNIERRAWY